MSSSTSGSSSAHSHGSAAGAGTVRRRQILSALDIDLWQVRDCVSEHRVDERASQEPGTAAKQPQAPRGAGPAAARALLEASMGGGQSPAPRQSSPTPAAPDVAPNPEPATRRTASEIALAEVEPLDLVCLSAPEGVLLAQYAGMTPMLSRLLNDVLRAAAQMGRGSEPLQKVTPQSLRFSWPPVDSGQRLEVTPDTAAVNRALRGFLNRQFQDKTNAFLLLASAELQARLADLEPALPADRVLFIGEPEALLGDGAAKRALWQTLKTL